MLRLWAIVLFCLFTYIHATATRGTESIEKGALILRVMEPADRPSLAGRPAEGLLGARSELNAHENKSADQAQPSAR